jgi:hypothetical protein
MKVQEINKVLYPFGFLQEEKYEKQHKKGVFKKTPFMLFLNLIIVISPLYYQILHQIHQLQHFVIRMHWGQYPLLSEI